MVHTISYDLNQPGQNYSDLYAEIKSLGSWCHPVDSTWFVDTSLSAKDVRDRLRTQIDTGDALIVVEAGKSGAWYGLSQEATDWLKNHL